MNIFPFDHVLRFRFESEKRPDIAHVVDLGAFDGFGECSCEDFIYRVRPSLVANGPAGLTRCKHILAAREHLLGQVIGRILEKDLTAH